MAEAAAEAAAKPPGASDIVGERMPVVHRAVFGEP